jgi:hypothetical protein
MRSYIGYYLADGLFDVLAIYSASYLIYHYLIYSNFRGNCDKGSNTKSVTESVTDLGIDFWIYPR